MSNYAKPMPRWAIVVVAIAGVIDAFSLTRPALAQALQALASVVTCNSTLPCAGGTNNGTGPGVEGISAKGKGVVGGTKFNATTSSNAQSGVFGQDLSTTGVQDSGVRGISTRGTGVMASSTSGRAVSGISRNSTGVYGSSTSGTGSFGYSANGVGLAGASEKNDGIEGTTYNSSSIPEMSASGVYGYDASTHGGVFNNGVYGASTNGKGVSGYSAQGTGVYGYSDSSAGSAGVEGVVANGATAVSAFTFNGGLLFEGISYLIGRDVFQVDASGNVYAHSFNATLSPNVIQPKSSGGTVSTYTNQMAIPSVEDVGEGTMIAGAATIRFDPAFSQIMDKTANYSVVITPEGDSNGLYVTQKSTAGFAVRENRGGRSTLAFSYRVAARPFGNRGQRLPVVVLRSTTRPIKPQLRIPAIR